MGVEVGVCVGVVLVLVVCDEPSMTNNCWPSRAPKTQLRAKWTESEK